MLRYGLGLLLIIFLIIVHGEKEFTFEAVILEVSEDRCLVEPVEGSRELNRTDQIEIFLTQQPPAVVGYTIAYEAEVGDTVEITYSGGMSKTYPAQLGEVYDMEIIKKAEE